MTSFAIVSQCNNGSSRWRRGDGLDAANAAIPECNIHCEYDQEEFVVRIKQNGRIVATIAHTITEEGELYMRQHLLRQTVHSYSVAVGAVCGQGNGSGEVLSLQLQPDGIGDEKVKLHCIGNEIRTPDHNVVALYCERRTRLGLHLHTYLQTSQQCYVLPAFILLVAARIFTRVVWCKRLDGLAERHDLMQYDKRLGMVVNEQAPSR